MPDYLLSELIRFRNCDIRRDASRRTLIRAVRRCRRAWSR